MNNKETTTNERIFRTLSTKRKRRQTPEVDKTSRHTTREAPSVYVARCVPLGLALRPATIS